MLKRDGMLKCISELESRKLKSENKLEILSDKKSNHGIQEDNIFDQHNIR